MITTKTGFFLALLGILFCCVSVFGQKNFSLDANSQNPQYQIDAWNAETDDFSNAILSILQGRDGYIWVGIILLKEMSVVTKSIFTSICSSVSGSSNICRRFRRSIASFCII